jgi:O-antigen/teichoic acid export membrane protein
VKTQDRPQFAVAVGWSYALAGSRVLVTTVVTFVLAALLGPEAIGLITMALLLVLFVEMLQQQGLLPAIVQRAELRREHADTAFWLVVAIGALLSVAIVLFAPLWAHLNSTPELTSLVWAPTPLVLLQSTVVVHEAILRREMRFRSLAIRTTVAGVTGGVVGVVCALAGLGVWSLVAQQLTSSVVGVVVLWRISAWRPRRRFDRTAGRQLFEFSRHSAMASVGVFLGNKADLLMAGIFFGPFVVGIYRLAERTATFSLEISGRAMQAVTLPELSPRQDDRKDFGRRFLRLQQLTAAVSLPVLGAVAGVAGLLGPALGDEWSLVELPLRGLAVAASFTAVASVAGPALQAMGSPGALAVISWARAVLMVSGLAVVGLLLGDASDEAQLTALVVVALVSATVAWLVMAIVLMHKLDLSVRSYGSSLVPGYAGGVVAGLTGWVAAWVAAPHVLPLVALLGCAGLAVVIGGVVSLAVVRPRPQLPSRARKVRARV